MRKIILGISSSISAYKACDLTRLFVKNGYDIHIVMTHNATKLITPLTLEVLSGNPVWTDSFVRKNNLMGHIALKDNAAAFLVAPATANIIGKFSSGIADDLLTTTFMSVSCPVIIAPAMNPSMWNNAILKDNIKRLQSFNIHIIGPDKGQVICGDEGEGKLSNIEEIYNETVKIIEL